jgi:predicted dehydrogenase
MSKAVGVGVIGMGVMGQVHVRAYQAAARAGIPAELVAVCDRHAERLTGSGEAGNLGTEVAGRLFDPATVRGYTDAAAMLADPAVHVVSICTPTDTHVDLAIAALRAGKHVLLEKPVAVEPEDVKRLAAFAAGSGQLCMPAMCMRFWPGWDWLRERIRTGTYGELRSATFARLGSPPPWNREFYSDAARTGGAIVDLHIHDTDFVIWCFGKPVSVCSQGTAAHVTTMYEFAAGPRHVTAEGAWTMLPSAPFCMRYRAAFARATCEWELGRTPRLKVYTDAGEEAVDLPGGEGYHGEVRHLLHAVLSGSTNLAATMADAVVVAEVLQAERRSVEFGGQVNLA